MSDAEPTAAEANVDTLRKVLELESLSFTSASRESDYFLGQNQYKPDGRVYGGQVVAQSVVAAAATLPDDRLIHSLHGYFLRAGDVSEPIEFGVERLRDGRSFSARRVHAYQKDVPILSLIASFQVEQEGLEHAETMPTGLPGPQDCPELRDILAGQDTPQVTEWLQENVPSRSARSRRPCTSPPPMIGSESSSMCGSVPVPSSAMILCSMPRPWPMPATSTCSSRYCVDRA